MATTIEEDNLAWEKFLHVLEWVLALQVRYAKDIGSSLVRISFHDPRTLGNAYGARDAVQMLIDLEGQVRSVLRKTDLVARRGTEIWLLIPFVTHQTVLSKVARIVEVAAENGLNIVEHDIAVFSIPDATTPGHGSFDSPLAFLDFIQDDKNVNVRWQGVAAHSE
jgi:hypothetical protein